MFETPAAAREYARGAPGDALVALGLELLRRAVAQAPSAPSAPSATGALAPLGAEAGAADSQIYVIQAELRAGQQQRKFMRGARFI
jgi:hypothetical protein